VLGIPLEFVEQVAVDSKCHSIVRR
jgi:hypothetical protein